MRPAYSRISSALRLLPCTRRPGRSAWLWFEAGERQASADSLRAKTLVSIHCAPEKQARRAQLIGMGASTPSRARRDRRGIGAPCVLPNRFRAAFAVRCLPLWPEFEVGVVLGRAHFPRTASFLGDWRSGKGQMGVGGAGWGARIFSIQTMSYQRPNFEPLSWKRPTHS